MSESEAKKIWRFRTVNKKEVLSTSRRLDILPLIATILAGRGITDPDAIDAFMHPTLHHLPSPFGMEGMEKAVEIIVEAVYEKRPVLLYGDYDVDGTTGIAVLALFFRSLVIEPHCLQPHRIEEGYGLHHEKIIRYVKENGIADDRLPLLITADCGISNIDEVFKLAEKGFKVVITDHHFPSSEIPPAHAVLNPKIGPCPSPLSDLAGVGVVFYLVIALRSRLRQMGYWKNADPPNLKQYLDLVAIGTICDVVPLTGVNRIMVRAGLEVLAGVNIRPGIKSLARVSGAGKYHPLSEEDVGYRLGPRLNAPGRMGEDPALALKLLLADNGREADMLAVRLDEINSRRRELSDAVFQDALSQSVEIITDQKRSLVLGSSTWHPGILGIAASRLQEIYNRPVFLFYVREGEARGSGRSSPDINMHEMLGMCDCPMIYGGHKVAAGVRLQESFLHVFTEQIEHLASRRLAGKTFETVLDLDGTISESEFQDARFFMQFEKLRPFGHGNDEPVFVAHGRKLLNPRIVGDNHLRFQWQENGMVINGIGFGLGFMIDSVLRDPTDLAFVLKQNQRGGAVTYDARLIDVRCT